MKKIKIEITEGKTLEDLPDLIESKLDKKVISHNQFGESQSLILEDGSILLNSCDLNSCDKKPILETIEMNYDNQNKTGTFKKSLNEVFGIKGE